LLYSVGAECGRARGGVREGRAARGAEWDGMKCKERGAECGMGGWVDGRWEIGAGVGWEGERIRWGSGIGISGRFGHADIYY
jgi:hypothetical protein